MHHVHHTESDREEEPFPNSAQHTPPKQDKVARLVERFLQFQWTAFKGDLFPSKPLDDFSE